MTHRNPTPAADHQELMHLRVRCAKIDEIERCALLLVETNEQLKAELAQSHLQLAEAQSSLLQLREEAREQAHRRRSPPHDDFQLLRLQQQLAAQQQTHDRAISTLESRLRAEQAKTAQQLKSVSGRV